MAKVTEPDSRSSRAIVRGLAAGLCAALLFGLSAPLAKRLLADAGPLWLAGLLYLGAGLGLSLVRGAARLLGRGKRSESQLRRQDAPLLLGITLLGGALAPVLMLHGLERLSGVAGALLLNLEAPFTIFVAVMIFREHLGLKARLAALLIIAGALVLTARAASEPQGAASAKAAWLGGVALAGACLCWALDNNLTQRLSLRDPWAVTIVKTLSAGTCNLVLSLVIGQATPSGLIAMLAMLVGFFSYGVSLLLDTYALRLLGAAREATIFSTAPFVGAMAAVPLLGERLGRRDGLAFGLMVGGVWLLARDRHLAQAEMARRLRGELPIAVAARLVDRGHRVEPVEIGAGGPSRIGRGADARDDGDSGQALAESGSARECWRNNPVAATVDISDQAIPFDFRAVIMESRAEAGVDREYFVASRSIKIVFSDTLNCASPLMNALPSSIPLRLITAWPERSMKKNSLRLS